EARHVRGFRWLRWRRGHRPKPRPNPVVEDGPPQADAQARACNLQRANCDADQFGDFLTTLAALNEILDLLNPLPRELDLAATPAKLDDLNHFSFILFASATPVAPLMHPDTPASLAAGGLQHAQVALEARAGPWDGPESF